jgi:hypothetical protein
MKTALAIWRAIIAALTVLINLTGRQMRALFSLAMLGGIVIHSATNWLYINMVRSMVDSGDLNMVFFGMILEQMRFNSAIVGLFALFVALIVFGADYLRAKHGDSEISFGKGKE